MARDREFKPRDKKTQRMTKDGLVELNQTTGEEQRVSQRGQEFRMRAVSSETAGDEALLHRGASHGRELSSPRVPLSSLRRGLDVENHDQRLQTHTAGTDFDAPVPAMDFDTPPADSSLPRQSSDTPVTSSPGHSSAPAQESVHSYHTEGGRLREESHRPDTVSPVHRQRGSGYYQKFQETPEHSAPAQHPAEPAAISQGEPHSANTVADIQPSVSAETIASATLPTEPPADMRADNLPLTPKPASSHMAWEVTVDAPLSGASEATPPLSERPGRLRFDTGNATAPAKRQRQSGTKYARKFTQNVEPDLQNTSTDSADPSATTTDSAAPSDAEPSTHDSSATPASDSGTAPPSCKKPSRLQFGAEELPPGDALDKKISKLQGKAKKTDTKLKKAREKLPTKKRLRTERIFDAEKGKPQRKIYFEQEVKSQREHLKGALPTRPVKAGVGAAVGFAHSKIHQVEHENVEVEAAHKGELIAESAARRAYRQHKTAPYRRVEKLSRTAARQHAKLTYQEALRDNPKLRSNMVSRFMQKRKIKRQYAKAARDTKRTAAVAKKTGEAVATAGKAIVGAVTKHPAVAGTVALVLLLMLVIMSTFGSCTNMAGSVLTAVLSGSYVAEDQDIDNAELSYTDWETALQEQIDNAETDHPGYDEYRYSLDEIGHDPYELLAYLTAKYRDYTFAEVQGELREIFAEQYTLEFVEEVEIRYYEDEDGNDVPYEWYILNVNLSAKPLADILSPRMDTDQRDIFDTLMTSKGNRQYSISPLGFDWLPNVTCNYGWRIHPISGARDFHNAVDIGIPEGTPILAGHDGRVVTASYDADGYGWYITLEGKNGLSTRYAHNSALLVSAGQEVKKGETIAKSGNTGNSTGPHLHFEVRVGGQTLNPLFFALTSGADSAE